MDLLSLSEEFRRVIFSQEEMVDSRSNLNTQPFGEFLILNAEVLDLLLFSDLLEQSSKTVTLNNISAEPKAELVT